MIKLDEFDPFSSTSMENTTHCKAFCKKSVELPKQLFENDVKAAVTSEKQFKRKRRIGKTCDFASAPTHSANTGSVHIKIYERCTDFSG